MLQLYNRFANMDIHLTLNSFAVLTGLGAGVGLLGSVLGVGGGIFIVPALVLFFHLPIHQAIASSLVTMIATSSAVASVNVERGVANMKLGMALEVSTAIGGLLGALVANMLDRKMLQTAFAFILAFTCVHMLIQSLKKDGPVKDAETPSNKMGGEFYDPQQKRSISYHVENFPLASVVSVFAGALSGLLGIGGGVVQVPLMHSVCKVPIKAAAATSNFMIGVTAASGAIIYYRHGALLPELTGALVLGVLGGSILGLKLLMGAKPRHLQFLFALLLGYTAWHMFSKAG